MHTLYQRPPLQPSVPASTSYRQPPIRCRHSRRSDNRTESNPSGWYSGRRSADEEEPPRRVARRENPDRRRLFEDTRPSNRQPPKNRPPPQNRPSPQNRNTFTHTLDTFKRIHAERKVINPDAWETLIEKISTAQDAQDVLERMRADARLREEEEWDWAARGYGKTLLSLVEAAGAVGMPEMADKILEPALAEELHVNVSSKDLIPSLMRKLTGASGTPTEALERLYRLEHEMRGSNTHMAAHELSRRYRKDKNVNGVQQLLAQAESGDAAMKEKLVEDLQMWLEKRQMTGL